MKYAAGDSPLVCARHGVPSGYGCPGCGDVVPTLLGRRPWWRELWLGALSLSRAQLFMCRLPATWLGFALLRAGFGIPWLRLDWWALLALALWGFCFTATRPARAPGRIQR